MKIPATAALAALFLLCPAPLPAQISYQIYGNTMNFKPVGASELELQPGDYSGDLVIPAGIREDGKLCVVTSLGAGSLASSKIRTVIVPHTVTTLNDPFRDGSSVSTGLDSIKFFSWPVNFNGEVPDQTMSMIGLRNPDIEPGGNYITPAHVVEDKLPRYHLLSVRFNGKLGICSYGMNLIPYEYDDYGGMYFSGTDPDIAAVALEKNGKWGLVDFNGNALTPFKYNSLEDMGDAKKISRTIARAFDKFYGDSAPAAAGELARTLSYSGIPYIFYMTRSIPADSVSMEIFDQVDSLLDVGQTDAARSLYRRTAGHSSYSAEVESLFAEAGALTHETSNTEFIRDDFSYSGPVDEFGLMHGYGEAFVEEGKDGLSLFEKAIGTPFHYQVKKYSGLWVKGRKYGPFEVESYDVFQEGTRRDSTLLRKFSGYLVDGIPAGLCSLEYCYQDIADTSSLWKKYYGELDEDWNRVGTGACTSFGGVLYVGQWENDMPHGYGRMELPEGDLYEGQFRYGEFISGEVRISYADGSTFEGQVDTLRENGSWNGRGKLTFANGNTYEGEIRNSLKHGRGVLKETGGDFSDGIFEDDNFISGLVRMSYSDGSRYEGMLENKRYNGHGKFTLASGETLEGNFKDGSPFGDFVITNEEGNVRRETFGEAAYLNVNGRVELEETVSCSAQTRTYEVTTDWETFEVSGLPDWIELYSQSDGSFSLRISSNNSIHERSGRVLVKAGGMTVPIYIDQEADENAVYGEIKRTWENDALRGTGIFATNGKEIHLEFDVWNLLGKDCKAVAFFEFSTGQRLDDTNGQYRSSDGQVAALTRFRPAYEWTTYHDLTLYIPYAEMHLAPGQHNLRYIVQIFSGPGELVCSTDYIYCTVNIF